MKISELVNGLICLATALRRVNKPHDPEQERDCPTDREAHPNQQHFHVHIPQAAIDAYIAADQERTTQDKQERTIDQWRLAVEAIGVLFVVIGAVAAIVTLIYVRWSTNAATEATKVATISFQTTQRAWLHVTGVPQFPIDIKKPITPFVMPIEFTNSGHLPAVGIRIQCRIEVVASDKPPLFRSGLYAITDIPILFPSEKGSVEAALSRGKNFEAGALMESQQDDLKAGRSYLAVYGDIFYSDDFGDHLTQFCAWRGYSPGAYSSRACMLYNRVADKLQGESRQSPQGRGQPATK